jgi:hypothetical protein
VCAAFAFNNSTLLFDQIRVTSDQRQHVFGCGIRFGSRGPEYKGFSQLRRFDWPNSGAQLHNPGRRVAFSLLPLTDRLGAQLAFFVVVTRHRAGFHQTPRRVFRNRRIPAPIEFVSDRQFKILLYD